MLHSERISDGFRKQRYDHWGRRFPPRVIRDHSTAVFLAHGKKAGQGEVGRSCGDALVSGKAENPVAFLRVLLVPEQERVKGEFPARRMGDMVAEVGIPAMAGGEKRGVVRDAFHASGSGRAFFVFIVAAIIRACPGVVDRRSRVFFLVVEEEFPGGGDGGPAAGVEDGAVHGGVEDAAVGPWCGGWW